MLSRSLKPDGVSNKYREFKKITKPGRYLFEIVYIDEIEQDDFTKTRKVPAYRFHFKCLDQQFIDYKLIYITSTKWTAGWTAYIDKLGKKHEAGNPSKLFTFLNKVTGKTDFNEICDKTETLNDVVGLQFYAQIGYEQTNSLDMNGQYIFRNIFESFEKCDNPVLTQEKMDEIFNDEEIPF